jgi:hypothetical protein
MTSRIATFDNDGTLWTEQPVVQIAFVISLLKDGVAKHSELKSDPIVETGLKGDLPT